MKFPTDHTEAPTETENPVPDIFNTNKDGHSQVGLEIVVDKYASRVQEMYQQHKRKDDDNTVQFIHLKSSLKRNNNRHSFYWKTNESVNF